MTGEKQLFPDAIGSGRGVRHCAALFDLSTRGHCCHSPCPCAGFCRAKGVVVGLIQLITRRSSTQVFPCVSDGKGGKIRENCAQRQRPDIHRRSGVSRCSDPYRRKLRSRGQRSGLVSSCQHPKLFDEKSAWLAHNVMALAKDTRIIAKDVMSRMATSKRLHFGRS